LAAGILADAATQLEDIDAALMLAGALAREELACLTRGLQLTMPTGASWSGESADLHMWTMPPLRTETDLEPAGSVEPPALTPSRSKNRRIGRQPGPGPVFKPARSVVFAGGDRQAPRATSAGISGSIGRQ
jgi:hypothetical protein